MAAATDPDEVLHSTREKENFQRLARLLMSGGTTLLVEIFDARCPPSILPTILNKPATVKLLKAAKLTKPQWDCLYPSPGVYGKASDFDVTLLFRLLKTICNLIPPVTGWDVLPTSTDQSLAADLARIKYYRNSVYAHVNQNMEITSDEFLPLWNNISTALVRIAGQISHTKKMEWQDAIDKFLKDPLTAEAERNVEELFMWYKTDIEVKEYLEELKTTAQGTAQDIKDIKDMLRHLSTPEGKDNNRADDLVGLEASTPDSAAKANLSQNSSEPKIQGLHMAVDQDVLEFITTKGFYDQLQNLLIVKNCGITWKPNSKTALIVYQGEDGSDSWQSECINEVQNYLGKFTKRDIQVNKDFWEAVLAQLSSVRACLGVDPPLVKTIDDSFVARIVSLSTDVNDYEEKLKGKLEEIYREETRKAYLKKAVPNVPKEQMILLEKMRFVEKLQEKNKELEIKLDTEGEEIYFEGPQPQVTEAIVKFYKQMSEVVDMKLSLSGSILEVLGSDKGLQKVNIQLENNSVEAVCVIDKDARIIGTSAKHADNAVRHVNKLMLEEKVQVDDRSKYLLKTPEWRQLCDEINGEAHVRVHRNSGNDTYVAGFRDDVVKVMKKLNNFLDNCVREERFTCTSQIVRRYISELRQGDLRSIENHLKDFDVKVKKGKGEADFDIFGTREGLVQVRKKLDALINDTASKTFDVKQPGLWKYLDSGKGDRLVKLVEKDQSCVIQVQKIFSQISETATKASASSWNDSDDDNDDVDDDSDDNECIMPEDGTSFRSYEKTGAFTLVTNYGQRISWRPGNIEEEKADALVCSVGASYQAIVNAGVPVMTPPNVGDITVSPGFPLANHVILTNCCQWQGGKGEAILRAIVQKCLHKGEELGVRSIAFPIIGAGKLTFPPDAASRIMLEETISFCQANADSNVQDVRFVVHQQDPVLTAVFRNEMSKLQDKLESSPFMGRLLRTTRSESRSGTAGPTGPESIDVMQGGIRQETEDAIVNINRKDINMENAGEYGKAVKPASGPQVEPECNQLGHQSGGTAVITSGGNLLAPNIIHLIPDSAQKDHLQQCVEKCLRLAEARGLRSISIPSVGTGTYGLSAWDSSTLIFQAVRNVSRRFSTVRKVRIVVFQSQILQTFQQEHRRHSSFPSKGMASRIGEDRHFSVEVIQGDLTQEKTDAIINILCPHMDMNNSGALSKAISRASGPQVQLECNLLREANMQDEDEEESDSQSGDAVAVQPRRHRRIGSASHEHSVKICVIGRNRASVRKAVKSLKRGFSQDYSTKKVESKVISELSRTPQRKACYCDIKLEIETDVGDDISVRGERTDDEMFFMLNEIWKEICKRMTKKQEEEQALLISMYIEWSYEIRGDKFVFSQKTNAKIEMAYSKGEPNVQVPLPADQFVIDLKTKTGRGQWTGELITLTRKLKGAEFEEEIALPKYWAPMLRQDITVHMAPLSKNSPEYQDVMHRFQATAQGADVTILQIERVQNPCLYKSYTIRKQKMDMQAGGNSERQLFHGTTAQNVSHINTQGFNRSFCGTHGPAYGRDLYFAQDAHVALRYSESDIDGRRYVYLARVLVEQYSLHQSSMIVPYQESASRPEILYESAADIQGNPSIFVVCSDNQCYPEYLITLQKSADRLHRGSYYRNDSI